MNMVYVFDVLNNVKDSILKKELMKLKIARTWSGLCKMCFVLWFCLIKWIQVLIQAFFGS
jgi:hypothetical protein